MATARPRSKDVVSPVRSGDSRSKAAPTRRVGARHAAAENGTDRFADWDLASAASRVGAGLPSETLGVVQDQLDLTKQRLAHVLGMSESTVERRKPGTTLSAGESERVYRIGRLTDLAERALGGSEEARAWMKEPNYALGDQIPLDLARTEPGARLVEQSLVAIEYGLPV
jgi:putative toxin-antitoxin system antitoxin component (TIGR02293 family)